MSGSGSPKGDAGTFAERLVRFVEDDERDNAVASLRVYMKSFAGRGFEPSAGQDRVRYSADDIVAVSMLGVTIPAEVSLWLLSSEGQAETGVLLKEVSDGPIWLPNADLSPSSHAWSLWKLLDGRRGMGRTITSKLMAVKRPHLVPIYDQHVADALGIGQSDYWALWQTALRDNPEIRKRAVSRAEEAGASSLSILRILDVVVWMRMHGYHWAPEGSLPYGSPLRFAT